ncbi:MAG: hypothetical protein QM820_33990 [Minicystis sp.]
MPLNNPTKACALLATSIVCLAPTAANALTVQDAFKNVKASASLAITGGSGVTWYFNQPLRTSTAPHDINFQASTSITAHDDFVLTTASATRTVSAQLCRQSWSGVSASCGTASSANYVAKDSGAYQLTPTSTGVQNTTNSVWDYYFLSTTVYTAGGVAHGFTPNGIGLSCW